MKTRTRVVVTGMGVLSASAHGIADFTSALRTGRSGIRRIPQLTELKFACSVGGIPEMPSELAARYFSEDQLVAMNEAMIYGGIAAIDAVRDAGLTISNSAEDPALEDTGAIVGMGIAGMDTISEKIVPRVSAGQVRRLGSTMVEQTMGSSVSALIGGILGLGNQVTTNSSACNTGTEAIIMGADRIRAGLARRMIVGGAEGSSPYIWAGFDAMKVLAREWNDAPERASRPLSATAGGFVPSSGSGILVIEDLDSAQARGARIYAEIIGSFINCGGMRNGGSITAPSSRSVIRCVRGAILDAEISPKSINYINGHLTGTMADTLEISNWLTALEVAPADFPKINSTKSMIGHSLGATGAVECIATLIQMRDGFCHPSLNCEDLHPTAAPIAKSVVREVLAQPINVAAKASFGFGDVNSCLIFRKWEEEA